MESWRVSGKLRALTDLEMELARKKLELYIERMMGGILNKEATYYVGNLVQSGAKTSIITKNLFFNHFGSDSSQLAAGSFIRQ